MHRDVYLSLRHKNTTEGQTKQSSIDDYVETKPKYSQNDQRQIQLTDALVLFIAGDLMPLSVVESTNFRNLCEQLNPRFQVPSRSHLTKKLLHEKSSEIQSNLKLRLKKAQSVCLTIDMWSNRQMKGFLGITGHYIVDWTMQSVMIACKRFKGKHTSENIRQVYEETIACFDIAEKIEGVISDNASNMVKAFDFSLPGFTEEKRTDGDDDDDDDSNDEKNDISMEDSDSTDEFDCLPKHYRCYAHSLQLVVRDGLKEAGQHLKTVIAKASNIVNFVRKSVNASEILEDEKKLQASNATRWNSQLYMIQSILNVPEEKLNSIECNFKLSTYERKLLSELCTILGPFEHVTVLVQKENNVSASLTVPVTIGLKHQMQHISSTFNNKMVSTFKRSINERLSQYEQEESYVVAAVLDARFKLRWCESDKIDHVESLVRKNLQSVSVQEDEALSPPPKKKQKTDDFFDFMSPVPRTPRKQNISGAVNELDSYLQEPCEEMDSDPLDYWKVNHIQYPTLARLANKLLAIPATSAPVERLFSIAGKVFRPERCSLKDETFERLMMIKCNHVRKNDKV